ncbi:MAG: flavodoxin family protein [Eubacteriales bacterium]
MKKKILVITGSPRKNGNTFRLADAFINTVTAKGHDVVRFDASFMNVGICHACETCFSTGKACTYNDDFNSLAPHIEGADAVVFITPLYWFAMPSALKAVIDKFFSFYLAQKDLSGKECALISCCEEPDASIYAGLLTSFKLMFELLNWQYKGSVLVTDVYAAGDIEKTDGVCRTVELANKF